MHCLVALCGCPCLALAVLGCWPFFFGRSSCFSVQMTPQAVAPWGVRVGRVRSRLEFLFVGPVANWHIHIFWVSDATGIFLVGKSPLAASNKDAPWFSSSLDCQVK